MTNRGETRSIRRWCAIRTPDAFACSMSRWGFRIWSRRQWPLRLSTVKNADRVDVLDEGRVIEAGTYHELRSRENGECREIVEMQSL